MKRGTYDPAMPKQQNPVLRIMPFFATLFIVFGVAAIVLTAPKQKKDETPTAATSTSPTIPTDQPLGVFETTSKIQLVAADGAQKSCDFPAGGGHISRVTKDGIDVVGGDGRSARLSFDCSLKDAVLPSGVLSPSGTHGARLGEKKTDGAATVIFSDGKNDQEVTIRGSTSRPFHDANIIGWMDDGHLAITAFQADALYALSVATTGNVTSLKALPEEADGFSAGDGSFWYVTVTPGQGIELPSRGPSVVHRIGVDGEDAKVAQDADSAIDGLLPGTGTRFAYTVGGTLFLVQGAGSSNVGTGIPIGWTDDGRLLVSRTGKLVLIGPTSASNAPTVSSTETGMTAPDDAMAAWYIPQGMR
jgi:hypothetical protein